MAVLFSPLNDLRKVIFKVSARGRDVPVIFFFSVHKEHGLPLLRAQERLPVDQLQFCVKEVNRVSWWFYSVRNI